MGLVHTEAIVLQSIKYQEKSLIVKCFTKELGFATFFVRNAFSKSKKMSSYFQPLTLLAISFIDKKNDQLKYFKSIELGCPYHTIHTQFHKSNVAIFLAEIFSMFLRNEPPNALLFDFLSKSFQWFDAIDEVGNFHLYVLTNYIKHSGVFPDRGQLELPYFHFVKGKFAMDYEVGRCFNYEDSVLFKKIFELSENREVRLVGAERSKLLQLILTYCSEQIDDFYPPKTLEVFSELYH